MKTKYFAECRTLEDVKKLYKSLAFKHHPDKGGETATMQEINLEYELLLKNASYLFKDATEEEKKDFLKYPEIISQVIGMEGIIIEIIGNWLWISGNTYQYKNHLKSIGFFFAPKKTMWYYRPADYKSSNMKPKSIDEIRQKYGSDVIDNRKQNKDLN